MVASTRRSTCSAATSSLICLRIATRGGCCYTGTNTSRPSGTSATRAADRSELAAASVGINLLPDTGVEVRNQMHVIDFAVAESARLGLATAGEIRSYTWDGSGEWAPATSDGGLASVVGFGYRRDGHDLAHDLRDRAQAAGRGVYGWAELVDQLEPRARYLSPLDRAGLLRAVVEMGGGVHEDEEEGFLEVTFP